LPGTWSPFTIGDAGAVWASFRVPAAQAGLLAGVEGATFAVEGASEVHRSGRRVAASQVVDPESRSLSVTFEVPNPGGTLRVGMLLQGHLLMGGGESGVAVPAPAIRMEDGVPVAYVQVGGELFQRRVLTLGPSDGEWTRILSGVEVNPAAVSDHGHPH